MRLFRFFIISLLVFSGVLCQAQTPTPHPAHLDAGLHWFPDLSSPYMELVGTSWDITNIQGFNVLRNNGGGTSTRTVTFWVGEDAKYIVIGYMGSASGAGQITVTLNGVTYDTVILFGNNSIHGYPIPLLGTNTEIVISKDTANSLFLTYVEVIYDVDYIPTTQPTATPPFTPVPTLNPVEIATAIATYLPDPIAVSGSGGGGEYCIAGSVSGTSGMVNTCFDMVITAGDVAIVNALLFLFFTVVVFSLMFLFMRSNRV